MRMRKLILRASAALAALVVLMAGAAIVLISLFDPNDYKPEILAQVKQSTGRDLRLLGDLELDFFPRLAVQTGSLELSDRDGFGTAPMVAMDDANMRIKLAPLLNRRVEIDSVQLRRPRIHLSRKADGTTNWDDLIAQAQRQGGGEGEDAPPDAALVAGVVVQGVSIVDGRVEWDDRADDRSLTLRALNLNGGKLSPGEALAVDLSVEVAGSDLPVPVAVTLTTSVRLDENIESISLENSRLRAATENIAATLSVEMIEFAPRTGGGSVSGLMGDAGHGRDGARVDTILEIPAIRFNLYEGTVQLPEMKLLQGDSSLVGSVNGGGVLSGIAAMALSGGVDVRIDDVAQLLRRNNLEAGVWSRLLRRPVTARFQFALAEGYLDLTDVVVESRGTRAIERKSVRIPVRADGSFDVPVSALLGEWLLPENKRAWLEWPLGKLIFPKGAGDE